MATNESEPLIQKAPFRRGFKPVEEHESFDLDGGIGRLEAEMHNARRNGISGLIRLRWEAWLEERMKEPAIRKLRAQQAVLFEQRLTAEAQISLKGTVLGGERDAELGKTQYNQALAHRLRSDMEYLGIPGREAEGIPALFPPTESDSPLGVHISDEQIEALALRAVMSIPRGAEGNEAIENYIKELRENLPSYAAQEVEKRVRELRRIAA